MANALYDKAREKYLTAGLNWLTDDIRAVLVDLASYTPNLATDEFLADIPAPARTATLAAAFTGKTAAAGVADADDITFSSIAGPVSEAIVLYKHTGVDATAELIAYIDTATGLPVTPGGGDITVAWDNGANKIFKL